MRYMLMCSCAIAALGCCTEASAQVAPPAEASRATDAAPTKSPEPVQSPDVEGEAQQSGEIVVTAQRRSESIQRAAVAISAVSGQALANANVTDPTRLTTIVPALQVTPSTGPFPQFYVRGVGNFAGNAFAESAVSFNVDGVYIARPSSTSGFFYDLDRVEVLKGPQGTLYGRNATGGAINVITHKPEFGETSGSFAAQYGNYNALRVDATVNLPLGETMALRASGVVVRHDGYLHDDTNDQNDKGARLLLRARPNPDLTIDLGVDYFNQYSNGSGSTFYGTGVDLSQRQGFHSAAGSTFLASRPNFVLGTFSYRPFDFATFMKNSYWGINSTIEYRASFGTFTIVPAYRRSRLNFQDDTQGFLLSSREIDDQKSVEARFATDETRPIRVLVGGYYLDSSSDTPHLVINFQDSITSQYYAQDTKSRAAFGRLTYAPAANIRFSASGRYTSEDKIVTGLYTSFGRVCLSFPCPAAQPFPYSTMTFPPAGFIPFVPQPTGTIDIPTVIDYNGANEKRAHFNRFTYRLGADWEVTPRNLLYVSYETGFKSGGFFFTSDDPVFAPEKIYALTLGSKNTFLDRKLTLNIEAFYWRYRDQQIAVLTVDSARNTILATRNVGASNIKGIEVEARVVPFRGTLLTADVQYLDAVNKSFTYSKANLNGGVDNQTGCRNDAVTATTYVVNCAGKRPVNAPRWTLNLAAQQNLILPNNAKVTPGVTAHYQSRTLTNAEYLPLQVQPGYWLLDATISYTTPDGRLSVGGFVNNALNRTVLTTAPPVTQSADFYSALLAPPRTYGIRMSARF